VLAVRIAKLVGHLVLDALYGDLHHLEYLVPLIKLARGDGPPVDIERGSNHIGVADLVHELVSIHSALLTLIQVGLDCMLLDEVKFVLSMVKLDQFKNLA